MSDKTVRTLLKELGPRNLRSVQADYNVQTVAALFDAYNVGAMPVFDRKKLVGVVSERDLVRKVISEKLDPETTMVTSVMTKNVVSVTLFTNLDECEFEMRKHGIRHLLVIENGEVIAMISIRDLLVSTREELEHLVAHLEDYIHPYLKRG